jgi:polar amino acid transport system permease protein
MNFDFAYALKILPSMLSATVVTLEATLVGFSIALFGGLVLAILRLSRLPGAHATALGVVDFLRTTPLLIQLYFLFYVAPRFVPALDGFTTGVLALGLHYSAYTSEVYRSGIEAVPRGQWEAALALNMRTKDVWIRIILPQAFRAVIPSLGNYLVSMFKETPILAVIAVNELLGTALLRGSETYRYFEPLMLVGAIFLALSLPSAALVRWLERRARHER